MALLVLLQNPLVAKYNDYGVVSSKEQVRGIIQQDIELFLNKEGVRLALYFHGTLIGCCGVYGYNQQLQQAQVGFELLPEFWGQGLMFDAMTTLIANIHQAPLNALTTLVAQAHAENQRSLNTLARLGFVLSEDTNQYSLSL